VQGRLITAASHSTSAKLKRFRFFVLVVSKPMVAYGEFRSSESAHQLPA
jgi:hypothetical protein